MKTIHRFALTLGLNSFRMPEQAKFLSTHSKDNEPQVWMLVDTDKPLEDRTIYVAATGENLDVVGMVQGTRIIPPCSSTFVGTVLMSTPDGTLVFHVFLDRIAPGRPIMPW